MRIGILLIITFLGIPFLANAQKELPISISWSNNQTTKPFQQFDGFFKEPIHSGIAAGTAFKLNNDTLQQLWQTANLGFLYHEDNQTAIQLYSEFMYRYQFHERWNAVAKAGLGYMHAFRDMPAFKLQDDGTYEQVSNNGRPQVMFTGAIGMAYQFKLKKLERFRVRLTYQPWFQFPFVNEYVPLLPYTALRLGVEVPLNLEE